MKRQITPILTLSIAIILIGSLAYAVDRKKQPKKGNQSDDPTHEEKALITELLESVDNHDKKTPAAGKPGKVVGDRADKKPDYSKTAK